MKKVFFFPTFNCVAWENFKNMFNLMNSMISLQLILVCVHFDYLKAKEHSFPINNEMCSLEKKKEIIVFLQRDYF